MARTGTPRLGGSNFSAGAEDLRFRLTPREVVEDRLRQYAGTNSERGARVSQLFVDAGCGEHLYEQPVKFSKVPNMDLDAYYDTYRLVALYLVYLDYFLSQPASLTPE